MNQPIDDATRRALQAQMLLEQINNAGFSIQELLAARDGDGPGASATVGAVVAEVRKAATPGNAHVYGRYWTDLVDGFPYLCRCMCPACLAVFGKSTLVDGRRVDVLCPCTGVTCGCPRAAFRDPDFTCADRFTGYGGLAISRLSQTKLELGAGWVKTRALKRHETRKRRRLADGRKVREHTGNSAVEHFYAAAACAIRAAAKDPDINLRSDPMEYIRRPKRPNHDPRSYDSEQLTELWNAIFTSGGDDPELTFALRQMGYKSCRSLCRLPRQIERSGAAIMTTAQVGNRRSAVSRQTELIAEEQPFVTAAHAALGAAIDQLANTASLSVAADRQAAVALGRNQQEHIARLSDNRRPIVFGRLDDPQQTVYVGRAFLPIEPPVLNWAAPAAARFHQAYPGDPQGLLRRRRIQCEHDRVTGVLDDIDLMPQRQPSTGEIPDRVTASIPHQSAKPTSREPNTPSPTRPRTTADAVPPAPDASSAAQRQPTEPDGPAEPELFDPLLSELERSRTGELLDIVATIQRDQYDILTSPVSGILVVQGGPGSGKTVVGLHRLAYLLYNNPRLTPRDVAVVSPNPVFAAYVAPLLPNLGHGEVPQHDLASLVPQVRSDAAEPAASAAVKGDPKMAALLARAAEQSRKPLEQELLLTLDNIPFRVPTDVIRLIFDNVLATRMPQASAREKLRNLLVDAAYQQLRETLQERDSYFTPQDAYNRLRTDKTIAKAVDRMWPKRTPDQFLRELLASRARLNAAADGLLTDEAVGRLVRPAREPLTVADAPLVVELSRLLDHADPAYRHVVVDEAQALSPMQARMLGHLARGSLTLLGDLAQSCGAWSYNSWDELTIHVAGAPTDKDQAAVTIRELPTSYRVPAEVLDFACRLLPTAAPGVTPPRAYRSSGYEPEVERVKRGDLLSYALLSASDLAETGTVALICPDDSYDNLLAEAQQFAVAVGDGRAGMLSQRLTAVPASCAAGLEFDHVVVIDPAGIAEQTEHGLRLLYVALTRCTKRLAVLHPAALPHPLRPGPLLPGGTRHPEDLTAAEPQQMPHPAVMIAQAADPRDHLRGELADAVAWLSGEDLGLLLALATRLKERSPAADRL
jgi:DNA helicase IV